MFHCSLLYVVNVWFLLMPWHSRQLEQMENLISDPEQDWHIDAEEQEEQMFSDSEDNSEVEVPIPPESEDEEQLRVVPPNPQVHQAVPVPAAKSPAKMTMTEELENVMRSYPQSKNKSMFKPIWMGSPFLDIDP